MYSVYLYVYKVQVRVEHCRFINVRDLGTSDVHGILI